MDKPGAVQEARVERGERDRQAAEHCVRSGAASRDLVARSSEGAYPILPACCCRHSVRLTNDPRVPPFCRPATLGPLARKAD